MNQIKHFFTSLNKWQTIVLVLGIGVTAWLLIQQYVFKPVCLSTMCPAVDPTLWPRIGFLAICTVVAIWLLKTPTIKQQDPKVKDGKTQT